MFFKLLTITVDPNGKKCRLKMRKQKPGGTTETHITDPRAEMLLVVVKSIDNLMINCEKRH